MLLVLDPTYMLLLHFIIFKIYAMSPLAFYKKQEYKCKTIGKNLNATEIINDLT